MKLFTTTNEFNALEKKNTINDNIGTYIFSAHFPELDHSTRIMKCQINDIGCTLQNMANAAVIGRHTVSIPTCDCCGPGSCSVMATAQSSPHMTRIEGSRWGLPRNSQHLPSAASSCAGGDTAKEMYFERLGKICV